jgi:VanZ family protein
VLGFMAILMVMASRPDSALFEPFGDKLLHGLAYFVLGFLALRAFHGGVTSLRVWPSVLAMLLTLGYAALEEWQQGRIPSRDSSSLDWTADALGAVCSIAFTALLAGVFARRLGKE